MLEQLRKRNVFDEWIFEVEYFNFYEKKKQNTNESEKGFSNWILFFNCYLNIAFNVEDL